MYSQMRQTRIIFISIIFRGGALVFSCKEFVFQADRVQVLVSPVRWAILHTQQRRAPAQVPGYSALQAKFTCWRKRKEREMVCKGSTSNTKLRCLMIGK